MLPHWIFIAISICTTLAVSLIMIKRGQYRRPLMIFLVLFLAGQAIGYGADIHWLKINVPHGENGTRYSLASTALPLALAFAVAHVTRSFAKQADV